MTYTSRDDFEAWALPILGDNPTWRESGDCEIAWQSWQASRKAKQAMESAREYLATEPSGERAELITKLRSFPDEYSSGYADGLVIRAADMLEADAQQATPYGWMVIGVPTVMRGSLAQEIQEQEAKRIGGTCKAFPVYTSPQQAKRVPPEEPEDLYTLALKADNWGQP